jgi:quinohemoprotein ethanol dehydrogenase
MAVYDSAIGKVREDYRSQQRRVLTFALDGKAALPPRPPKPKLEAQPDPDFIPDQTKWLAGIVAYHQQCVVCHGGMAIGVGTAPDLRASAIPMSAEAFRAIVHDGALTANGMPQFSQLDDPELEAIRHYLRHRARELAEGK